MISIKKEKHTRLIKITILILFLITIFFLLKQSYAQMVNKQKIESLNTQIQIQKKSNDNIRAKIEDTENRVKELIASYPSTQELEERLQKIFKRMSVLDFELVLLGTKKLCIDRHVIISRLEAKSQEGQKAGLGILNYLGKTQKSTKNETVYFVDYISSQKALK